MPYPYEHSDGNNEVEWDLSDYARKGDLKKATDIATSTLASKTNLASLEINIGVDKVKTVPTDLSKLSNVVDNNVIKKTVYDKLFTKVNAIHT